jgi:hypothetical protein
MAYVDTYISGSPRATAGRRSRSMMRAALALLAFQAAVVDASRTAAECVATGPQWEKCRATQARLDPTPRRPSFPFPGSSDQLPAHPANAPRRTSSSSSTIHGPFEIASIRSTSSSTGSLISLSSQRARRTRLVSAWWHLPAAASGSTPIAHPSPPTRAKGTA